MSALAVSVRRRLEWCGSPTRRPRAKSRFPVARRRWRKLLLRCRFRRFSRPQDLHSCRRNRCRRRIPGLLRSRPSVSHHLRQPVIPAATRRITTQLLCGQSHEAQTTRTVGARAVCKNSQNLSPFPCRVTPQNRCSRWQQQCQPGERQAGAIFSRPRTRRQSSNPAKSLEQAHRNRVRISSSTHVGAQSHQLSALPTRRGLLTILQTFRWL